ncbi:MAG: hypothetical protein Q9163_006349, partial [Psora crenata]
MSPNRYFERIERYYKRQFFQWYYIDEIQVFKDLEKRFNVLFDEMYEATGTKDSMTARHWQGRKRVWDAEWRIPGEGPSPAVLEELSKLPLWYEGGERLIEIRPCHVVREANSNILSEQESDSLPSHAIFTRVVLGPTSYASAGYSQPVFLCKHVAAFYLGAFG